MITYVNTEIIDDAQKSHLFDMYVVSYSMGGQDLWFKTPAELIARYPCLVHMGDMFAVYAMFQFKPRANKLSLFCHNGTPATKQQSIDLRLALVSMPGFILEASAKVAWLLRKLGAPIIRDRAQIESLLDNAGNPNDTIEMNPDFDISRIADPAHKNMFQYTRVFRTTDAEGRPIEYSTHETMFGVGGCEFAGDGCDRRCISQIVGGKRRPHKRITRKIRRTKRKKMTRKYARR